MNKLKQLKTMTTVVADTGDFDSIGEYKPADATTNPSLIYTAAQLPQYRVLVEEAKEYGRMKADTLDARKPLIMDRLAVIFGREILSIAPRRMLPLSRPSSGALPTGIRQRTVSKHIRLMMTRECSRCGRFFTITNIMAAKPRLGGQGFGI
jgi:hypothetical protein